MKKLSDEEYNELKKRFESPEDKRKRLINTKICDFIDFLCMLSFIGVVMELFDRFLKSPAVGFLVGGAIIIYYYSNRDIKKE